MNLFQVVLKDIARRKRRILYAALGVTIGTMTVVGTLTIAEAGEARIYNQLEKYGPNLTVIPAISNLDVELGDLSLGTLTVGENYISEEELVRIRDIADSEIRREMNIEVEGDLATISPRLYMNTEVKGTSVTVVGVNPEEEYNIKTWWRIQKGAFMEQEDQALAGSLAAELLELDIGDTISLNGSDLTITGVLEESGANDDYQIFVPLETVQNASHKEGLISSIDVRALCNACPVEMIAEDINQKIAGVRAIAVKQVATAEMGMMDRINRFMLAIAGITLIVGLFGVINSTIASVHERIRDIGIMKAVGASRNQILRIFIYEAIIIGLVGGVFGYICGTLLAYAIGPFIFEGTSITYVVVYLPLSLAIATAIAVVAAIYPAFSTSRIRIADSFRSL